MEQVVFEGRPPTGISVFGESGNTARTRVSPGLAGFSRGIDHGLLTASLLVLATFKFTGASLRIFGST